MDEVSAIVDGLRPHVAQLDTTDPTADVTVPEPLSKSFEETTVVGMGEATHGTREFFRLKHRLFRFLVAELDFRVFALEANFAETLALNEYVLHGEGDPEAALEGVYFWTWNTEEVLALVEWIRAYNRDRPADDRVRFYGFDAQFTAGPADAITTYLELVDPAFLEEVADRLEMLTDEGLDPTDGDAFDSRLAATNRLLSTLDQRFEEREDAYVAAASEDAWHLAKRHRRTLEQAIELKQVSDPERTTAAYYETRDEAMAENVAWIVDHEAPDRVALWAHNGHVMKGEWQTEDGGSAETMGNFLDRRFGSTYYALGFDFGRGTFRVLVESENEYELRDCSFGDPPAESAAAVFDAIGHPVFFLDVDSASDGAEATELLCEERPFRSVGAEFYADAGSGAHEEPIVLATAFDGLCFVSETTSAIALDRS